MTESGIRNNLKNINSRIQASCKRAGRDPDDILLVAISKTKPLASIKEAFEYGQFHFGENRARELQQKMENWDNPGITWHFVGPMQTNKIKYMAGRVDWIHSVYKRKYLTEIEKRASETGRMINALIQVNISNEDQKQGCSVNELPAILGYAQELDHVRVRGLMGMATYTDQPEEVRDEFRRLKEIFESHQHLNGGQVHLEHISMGMTNDFEVAIEEGATIIRIGTAIFGERDYSSQ